MKKVEVSELILAKLKANQATMDSLRTKIQMLQSEIKRNADKNQELADEIREQVEDCPDTPLEKWLFDEVDWDNLEGEIKIPEMGEAPDRPGQPPGAVKDASEVDNEQQPPNTEVESND